MAYDWDTSSLEQIVADELPTGNLGSTYTWNADMSQGLHSVSSGLNGAIYWMTPDGFEPFDVTINDGFRSWSLAENFLISGDSSNFDIGISFAPAWSTNTNEIAFMASTDSFGQLGFSRGDSEFKLYLMDPEEQIPNAVLDGIMHPTDLQWSPDGDWLAFNAFAGNPRRESIWLFSPQDNLLINVAEGMFFCLVWSPQGNEIAATLCKDIVCDDFELLVFDVGDIVNSE